MTYSYCIFCDDIKREDNGKTIMIGVYNTEAVVPSLPFEFRELNLAIRVVCPVDEPVTINATKVFVPGKNDPIIIEHERSLSHPENEQRRELAKNEVLRGHQDIKLTLNDLNIKAEGRLKVILDTDKGDLYSGALWIMSAQEMRPPPMQADAVLASILLYRKLKSKNKKMAKDYLPKVMEVINNYVAPEIENNLVADHPYQFELTDNRFRVFSISKIDTEKQITFLGLPKNTKHKISDRDRHGFEVEFINENEKVNSFEWEFKK